MPALARRPRQATAFDPREIRNLLAWYRPEVLIGKQGDGAAVWLDSSGRMNVAFQNSAPHRPPITLIRNLNRGRARGIGVEFDGSQDNFDMPALNLGDNLTVFAAALRSTGATGGYRALLSSKEWNLYANMNSSRWGLYGSSAADSGQSIRAGNNATPSPPSIITAIHEGGTTTTLLTNGGAKVTVAQSSSENRGNKIGADSSGVQFFEGALFEMIVFDRALRPFERRPIEEYLIRRHVDRPEFLINASPE